jgi:DNA-binding LacI/PurR family transcriptional regulator
MAVTIKDVAKMANVSPSTVSRVLSDSNMISQETKEMVRKVVKELNYHPHAIARSLANRETKTIGLILHINAEEAFLNPFFPELIRGISKVLTAQGYYMLLSTSKNDTKGNEELIGLASERRIDGLILLTSWVDDAGVRALREEAFPTVVIGQPSKDIQVDWVDSDNQDSAYNSVNHLLSKGYSKIAIIGGSSKLMVTVQRIKGYVNALMDNNIEPVEDYFKECNFSEQSAYNAMKELLELPEKPDAVICSDDMMTFGAIRAIHEAGLNVPNDVGIIVYNNTLAAEYMSPTMTSIDMDVVNMGESAAKLLLDRIKNPDANTKSKILNSKIIIRDSTNRGEKI